MPRVAGGSGDAVVIVRGAFSGKVSAALRTAPLLSSTVTVNVALPALGGVPVKTPAGLRVSQPGRPVADQVYTPLPPVAASVKDKSTPAVAVGSGEVVVITKGGFRDKVKAALWVALELSVTVTVKEALPAAGGVPVKTPAALRVSQLGKPVADHVYTPLPPVAANVMEKAAPAVAAGNGEAVAMAKGGLTDNVNAALWVAPALSVAVAVKAKLPVTGGVPAKTPAGLRVNQAGRPVADQLYTAVPPVAASVSEKATPVVAEGSAEAVAITSAAFTGKLNEPLRLRPASSDTVTVKATAPAAGGVPVRMPLPLMLSQGGRPPASQVNPAPPMAVNAFE